MAKVLIPTLLSVVASISSTHAAVVSRASGDSVGKRGLAYNVGALTSLFAPYPSITWGYNWGVEPTGLDSQFEYVPMLWGNPSGNEQYIQSWLGNATQAIAAGSKHLLAFNEPDLNGLSPEMAAAAYMTYMQPFASDNVQLGAPAVSNAGAPSGLTWLEQFMGNCTACTIDFVPFHWYCAYDDLSYFVEYVAEALLTGGNRPLWITEFQADNEYCSAPATDAQQSEFMRTVIPWLDSLDYVQRYAYFMATQSNTAEAFLVGEKGEHLTQSGWLYASIDTVNSTVPTSLRRP